MFAGVREVTRTPDLPLRRRSLYPTELRRHLLNFWEAPVKRRTLLVLLGGGRSILLSYGNIIIPVRLRMAGSVRNSLNYPKPAAESVSPHTLLYQKMLIRQDTNFAFPIIQICPLKRRPISGSPIRSLRLIATWKITSLQSSFRL